MSPTRTSKKADGAAPILMRFDDNALLTQLFGEHDRNLARIEQALGVVLASRGNELAITGPPGSVETARLLLIDLYDQLERGIEIGGSEVEAALRMAESAPLGAAAKTGPAASDTVIQTRKRQIAPRSRMQAAYVRALKLHELVFGLGPAGTGKTYLAVAMAVSMFTSGKVDRIILSRPAVEAGERLGFLPGDLKEKVDPYLRPLYDALYDMMPADTVAKKLETGEIDIAPLAFMRGRTLSNAYIILDEAQNTTPVQMKMFLTRMGENSRLAVTGDLSQVDLPPGDKSGLRDAVETLDGMEGVSFIHFTHTDVVRNLLVTRIVRAYEGRSSSGVSAPSSSESRKT